MKTGETYINTPCSSFILKIFTIQFLDIKYLIYGYQTFILILSISKSQIMDPEIQIRITELKKILDMPKQNYELLKIQLWMSSQYIR